MVESDYVLPGAAYEVEKVVQCKDRQETVVVLARSGSESDICNEQWTQLVGHPVQYIIDSDGDDFRRAAVEILVPVIWQMKWLRGIPIQDALHRPSASEFCACFLSAEFPVLYEIAENQCGVAGQ